MKSSEDAIEKVMAGLREAKASPGMERRILEAIDDRASARSRSGWRGWLTWRARPSAGRSLAWGVAVAGVLIMMLILPSTLRQGPAPVPSKRSLGVSASLPTMASETVAESGQPPTSRPGSRPIQTTSVLRKAIGRDRDRAALPATRIASHPAPPIPLSNEEKLLLRVAHEGHSVELAMLNPEMRARQEAEANAEFQRFFGQPTTQDNE